jgi:hypothetical protein
MPAQTQIHIDMMMIHASHPDAKPQVLVLQRKFRIQIDENR